MNPRKTTAAVMSCILVATGFTATASSNASASVNPHAAARSAASPKIRDVPKSKIAWNAKASWKACPTPTWPRPTAKQLRQLEKRPGKGNRVLVVGDSLTRYHYDQLNQAFLNRGWLPTIVCWGGKTTTWGLQQVKRLDKMNKLPEHVVVSLGTNDLLFQYSVAKSQKRTQSILKYLQPRATKVWWMNTSFVTNRVSPARFKPRLKKYRQLNRAHAKAVTAAKRKGLNIRMINWARKIERSKKRTNYTSSDGIHDSAKGRSLRTRMIVTSVKV